MVWIGREKHLGDFYGSFLRLGLIGYLRPETKFESIDKLIQQIGKDVISAQETCNTLRGNASPEWLKVEELLNKKSNELLKSNDCLVRWDNDTTPNTYSLWRYL